MTRTLESPTETDETAIYELFMHLEESWNAQNATAYGECFTLDGDYITFEGSHLQGRTANTDFHNSRILQRDWYHYLGLMLGRH